MGSRLTRAAARASPPRVTVHLPYGATAAAGGKPTDARTRVAPGPLLPPPQPDYRAKYGPIYRNNDFGTRIVVSCSPEANDLVFLNKYRIFSSGPSWGRILGRPFPRGRMLVDFDEHRLHRNALDVGFRPERMAGCFEELDAGIDRGVAAWPELLQRRR